MKKLFLLLSVFLFPLCAAAQGGLIEAWTRGLTQSSFESIVLKTTFAPKVGGAAFYKALNTSVTPRNIPTTPDNLVYSVVNYSKVFSKKEQQLLLPRESQLTKVGKIAFVYDRSAALYNQIKAEPNGEKMFSEHAFEEHQSKLAELGATLETYLRQQVRTSLPLKEQGKYEDLVALLQKIPSGFEREDISRLLSGGEQPLFPVMSRRELQQFAALQNVESQRQWVAQMKAAIESNQQVLLSHDSKELSDMDFLLYYMQNLRLQYLGTLDGLLAKSTAPRKSLIYRYRADLKEELPFVSKDLPLMTDAQRLGYLQFHKDTFQGSPQELEQLEAVLKKQKELYQPYATAEAFGLPYETVLDKGYMHPMILGEETQQRIAASGNLEKDLAPDLEALEQQIASMREMDPEDLSFLTQYYRLTAQRDIYKAEIARQNFFKRLR